MTAKSMEMPMHPGKFSSMNFFSSGVAKSPTPFSKQLATSGALVFSSRMMVLALQRKIPEFQKNSPDSRNTLAISSLGFSVKVLTW